MLEATICGSDSQKYKPGYQEAGSYRRSVVQRWLAFGSVHVVQQSRNNRSRCGRQWQWPSNWDGDDGCHCGSFGLEAGSFLLDI